MSNENNVNKAPAAVKPNAPSWLMVLVAPPVALIGTSIPLWHMEEPVSGLVDFARHGSFLVSALYVVLQVALIAVRGRPLFVDKK